MKPNCNFLCRAARHNAWLLLPVVLGPSIAHAQFGGTATASAGLEHNSNVFALPSGESPASPYAGSGQGDTLATLGVELRPTYQLSQQKFLIGLNGNDFRYNHFTALNHREYGASVEWQWVAGGALDGDLLASRTRDMVHFADVRSSELFLQTTTNASGRAEWHLNRRWSIEARGSALENDSPRPNAQSLVLKEHSYGSSIKFGNTVDTFFAIAGDRYDGTYTGAEALAGLSPNTTITYHRETLHLVGDRSVSKDDVLHGEIGYTKTTISTGSNYPGAVTGNLRYRHQLTGKTSVEAGLRREVVSYITTAGQEISTLGDVGALWHATGKIDVTVRVAAGKDTYPGWNSQPNGLPSPTPLPERSDTSHQERLSLTYTPWIHVSVAPYVQWNSRSSSIDSYGYSQAIYGIVIKGLLP